MVHVVRDGGVTRIYSDADGIATFLGWAAPWIGIGVIVMGIAGIVGGQFFVPSLQILCGVIFLLWIFRPYHSELSIADGKITLVARRPYLGEKKESFDCASVKGLDVIGGGASKWVSVWLVRGDGSRALVVGGIANDRAAPDQVKKVCSAVREAGIAFKDPPFLG